jgi:hypothetical protein
MAGDLTMRVELRDGVYVLRREECVQVLAALEAAGGLGPVAAALREDLRRALDGVERVPVENPFDGEEEPPAPWEKAALKNVAKENAEECGDCRVPRCRFCDLPVKRSGGRKDESGRTVERYYVCQTPGCIAAKVRTPQPLALFSGGK